MAERKPLTLIAGIPQGLPNGDTIAKEDVGLGNVDNTSDANKPVSSATQTALNLKANLSAPAFTGNATFDTDTLKIDATNNRVGVCNASPSEAFDVVGNIRSSTGIKFGSNAVGGNITGVTLNYYEKGNWTPTLPNGGTLSVTHAKYVKIGDVVHISLYIYDISPTANSSYFSIGGLPFAPSIYSRSIIPYSADADLRSWGATVNANETYLLFHALNGINYVYTNNDYLAAVSGKTYKMIALDLAYLI